MKAVKTLHLKLSRRVGLEKFYFYPLLIENMLHLSKISFAICNKVPNEYRGQRRTK